jgi:hypothetical protein
MKQTGLNSSRFSDLRSKEFPYPTLFYGNGDSRATNISGVFFCAKLLATAVPPHR